MNDLSNKTGPEIRREIQAIIDEHFIDEHPTDLAQVLTDEIVRARYLKDVSREPNKNQIPIESCSVRVMKSFDYSHFEITLSTTLQPLDDDNFATDYVAQVDELRKTAARLADKAVEQYKIAKVEATRHESNAQQRKWDLEEITNIKLLPEDYRTSEQKAKLKAHEDGVWRANREYDYQDDWDQEANS